MAAGRQEQKRHLAAEMAAAIRDGAYRPGEWLRQIDLEERFGAKRFDVRSALSELAVRGTVEHIVNRGYRVAVPDMTAIREILAIRILVETEAAREALPKIGPAELARIKAMQQAFETAVAHGSRVDQARTNADFHDAIYGCASNRTLGELTTEMRNRSIRWPIALWPSHASLEKSAADHRAIVAAIEARDIDALVDAVRQHISGSGANYPSDETGLG
ncbi:MAG: GntR family transcriptional regulator [Phreatobacter sp.]